MVEIKHYNGIPETLLQSLLAALEKAQRDNTLVSLFYDWGFGGDSADVYRADIMSALEDMTEDHIRSIKALANRCGELVHQFKGNSEPAR
jgi:hypothetical protein